MNNTSPKNKDEGLSDGEELMNLVGLV